MYQLMIVEDEKSTREGLKDCVDWNRYDIKVVAEAPNGQEALNRLHEMPIDIVLTDVVMPIMDGIELVRQIRCIYSSVKVIFISGYWDMPYLKSAFQLDAIDYILKPIKLEELEQVIQKVTEICRLEKEAKQNLQEMKNKLAASLPLMRERFISRLLTGSIKGRKAILQKAAFLDLPFEQVGYYTVFTIQINPSVQTMLSKKDKVETMEEHEILLMKIKELVESTRIADLNLNIFCSIADENRINFILYSASSTSYDRTIEIAQQMQDKIKNATSAVVSVGIGDEVPSVEYLNRSWQKSVRALDQGYFLGEGAIIHYKDIDLKNEIPSYYSHPIQEQICNAIRLGREKEVKSLTSSFFQELYSYTGMNIDYVRTICLELIILAERILLESGDSKLDIGGRKDMWKKVFQLKTLKQTEEWMSNQLCDMAGTIDRIQNTKSKSIVERMKSAVQRRCSENITIQELAEELYFTPNYICMLFKKETGESFREYLTKVRLERAKTLLRNSTMKLYEIAGQIGYTDPDYFTRIFRKYTGVTPTEYRERLS